MFDWAIRPATVGTPRLTGLRHSFGCWQTSPMVYLAEPERYETMPYRRSGRSGLHLPAVSLGLWQNFGDVDPLDRQRAVLRRAFDLGVTHFDLANNYGPPYGSAETNFGRLMAE